MFWYNVGHRSSAPAEHGRKGTAAGGLQTVQPRRPAPSLSQEQGLRSYCNSSRYSRDNRHCTSGRSQRCQVQVYCGWANSGSRGSFSSLSSGASHDVLAHDSKEIMPSPVSPSHPGSYFSTTKWEGVILPPAVCASVCVHGVCLCGVYVYICVCGVCLCGACVTCVWYV